MAGQGVNLGYSDVKTLTKCLEKAVRDGADLGAVTYLREYDSNGQRHNMPVQIVCDWLNRLYRTDLTPVVLVRSLGLFGVNKITPLKVCSYSFMFFMNKCNIVRIFYYSTSAFSLQLYLKRAFSRYEICDRWQEL
ncbi:unnamed protein product [Anisakis simplex]|uniref:Uncharacterized protein n=1 Tax=Anisakis simplex TaxID=6269 RepID=A0A3P6Q9M0_ANISI|nr:unnamed protein product [Anisakis simplex]